MTAPGRAEKQIMLKIKDIRKQYRTGTLVQEALDGVSLAFRENEFVAILGPSGSGKTTLLNVIGGIDEPLGDLPLHLIERESVKRIGSDESLPIESYHALA